MRLKEQNLRGGGGEGSGKAKAPTSPLQGSEKTATSANYQLVQSKFQKYEVCSREQIQIYS